MGLVFGPVLVFGFGVCGGPGFLGVVGLPAVAGWWPGLGWRGEVSVFVGDLWGSEYRDGLPVRLGARPVLRVLGSGLKGQGAQPSESLEDSRGPGGVCEGVTGFAGVAADPGGRVQDAVA